MGSYSGPAGTATLPLLQGLQVWVKFINANGGVRGHAVELLVYDDGADPARHRAQVQEAIEQRKIVAFLGNMELLTGGNSVSYINSKRIPVIGMSGGEDWALSSPMYFPQLSTGDMLYRTFPPAFSTHLTKDHPPKIGTLVCAEAAACSGTEKQFVDGAAQYRYEHVYKGRASLAQPDFTAECLAARNAGVEGLWINMDDNTVRRVAAACARQGFRPTIGMPTQAVSGDLKADPNLKNVFSASAVFPFFQTGAPAADEFQAAMRTYGQGLKVGGGTPFGWVAGKLLERAAGALAEPPTTLALLTGLWSIQNDTLGGLTFPLTFLRDQPPPGKSCWFNISLSDGRWESRDQGQFHCL